MPLSKWLGSPPFTSYLGHLEGVPQPYLGDLRSPWLLTTYYINGMILVSSTVPRSTGEFHALSTAVCGREVFQAGRGSVCAAMWTCGGPSNDDKMG